MICTDVAPNSRISVSPSVTKSSQRRVTITTAAGGPVLAAFVCFSRSVLPMKPRTSPMWSRTWTAVVGSLTAGESALLAMSTIIRSANAGSWSKVRSSPSAIIPSSSSAAPSPNSPP